MTVTFIGHRDAMQSMEPELKGLLIRLIEEESADCFYAGNEGNFDRMTQKILAELSVRYPAIRCFTVLAYLPRAGAIFSPLETIYPEGLETVPRRFSLCKRNQWMLTHSDTLVCHVLFPGSNSAKLMEKARRSGKRVINLQYSSPENPEKA